MNLPRVSVVRVDLAILARFNHQIAKNFGGWKQRKLVSISRYLDENLVLFLKSDTRDVVIHELIELLDEHKKLKDKKTAKDSIK